MQNNHYRVNITLHLRSRFWIQSPPMSSPARSSASATSAGQGGGSSSNAAFGDDTSPYHFPDHVSPHERKEEALSVLKSDLMEALQKEVKSLDDDNWMFAGPRSQINLISRPGANLLMQTGQHGGANLPMQTGQRGGANLRMQTGQHGEANQHNKQTRHAGR